MPAAPASMAAFSSSHRPRGRMHPRTTGASTSLTAREMNWTRQDHRRLHLAHRSGDELDQTLRCLVFTFISLPGVLPTNKENRNASVPTSSMMINGSMTLLFDLPIFLPCSSRINTVQVDLAERDISRKFQTEHDHPCHPEKEDVIPCLHHRGWIEVLVIWGFIRPARALRMAIMQTRTMYPKHPDPARYSDYRNVRIESDPSGQRSSLCTACNTTPVSGDPTKAGARCTNPGYSPASCNTLW